MKIGILGTGTWGTALARMLALHGHQITAWSAIAEEVDMLAQNRTHPNLPGMVIPSTIAYTKNIEDACTGRELILFAVPSVYVRSTAAAAKRFIAEDALIVDVAKGIESDTLLTMTQIIADTLQKDGTHKKIRLVALSGPTHAEEVAKDLPTTIVSASSDADAAAAVQKIFTNDLFRVYTNPDIQGVELCGAVKNIMALATGIALGLGYGDNLKAAIMTRGMAEIVRLGTAMGCKEETFFGLAGIGDLIVTATSVHSRNNRAGQLIGMGYTAEEAKKEVGMVVEGIYAIPAALELGKAYKVELPIVEAVDAIVNHGTDPKQAVGALMRRSMKSEQ